MNKKSNDNNGFNRRDFIKIVSTGFFAFQQPRAGYSVEQTRKHPNIIFILADDMGIGDAGRKGDKLDPSCRLPIIFLI